VGALLLAIVAFTFGFVGSMPVAGPISVMVVARAASGRAREAMSIGVGAAIAEGLYALLAFWGFATFLARHQAVLPLSHAVSAVVLLVVGVRFILWHEHQDNAAPARAGGPFLVGFTVSALNPTLLATWGVATTFLYSKRWFDMSAGMAVPFGAAAAAGVGCWNALVVWGLDRYKHKFPRHAIAWFVRGMGVVLVVLAVWSGIELVRYVIGVERPLVSLA
jgi:threonine/homoserine/homoserine lactone efflux protein